MNYDKFFKYFLYCFCIFGILFNICNCKRGKETETHGIVERVDTVYKIDTVIIEKPKLIYKYISRVDTMKLKVAGDTIYKQVEVPIETKEYKDSTYYCKISGFQPILEHLEVYPKETTIEKKITSYKAKKWGFTVGGGIGYDFNKITPFIGVTYGYRF